MLRQLILRLAPKQAAMLRPVLRDVRRRMRDIRTPSTTAVIQSAPSFGADSGVLYRMFLEHKGDDLFKWHHYFAIYERYFARFRDQPISLLEIGVRGGGSLALWRQYFGPRARITGIDIDPACVEFRSEGTEIFIGDQVDRKFLADVADQRGPFDIVIDDGGHTTRQQIVSYEALFPHVKDGGVYLVEDLHTNLWGPYLDHPLGVSFLDVASRMAEKLTWWHNRVEPKKPDQSDVPAIARSVFSIAFYDSIVVFEKMRIPEPHHEIR